MIFRSCLTAVFAAVLCSPISAQTAPAGTSTGKVLNTTASAAANTPEGSDYKYRIGFRDKLSVQVFKRPELSGTVSVNPDGTISLFKLQPLAAVCKTEQELARDIAAAYEKDYLRNPEVTVVATEQMSQSLSVIGAVEKPGTFFVSRRVHLLELLALAGGPSKEAGSRVMVARMGSNSNCSQGAAENEQVGFFTFDINDLQEGKQGFFMQPGDVVSVRDADLVFVYGNVNEQGQVVMKQPMTLTQVIASAKGLKPATKKDKVRIIRQKQGSTEPEVIVVDLVAVDKQKAVDPFLHPNDIVAFSEDKTKSILNSVTKSFTQGIPGLLYRPY